MYKDLYYKLQHLEEHPEILPCARVTLCSLLSEAYSLYGEQSILSLQSYNRKALGQLLHDEHEQVLSRWEQGLATPPTALHKSSSLFTSHQKAKEWLHRNAPVKYVDGAWLGHLHKITTPFALRGITKDAWQTLSEELGDGDLEKNHVYLYRQLLRNNDILLPDGDSLDFVSPHYQHGMDDVKIWRAAVSQLLISLFPDDFLPEIFGFNLHFEQLTLETLMASRELPRYGISAYYFQLHISIDNADSGHAAMALGIVDRYMNLISETKGEEAAQVAWRRVQAGYMLSRSAGDVICEAPRPTEDELTMIAMFKEKARVSQKIHCPSRAKIGHRTVTEWLSPELWSSQRPQDLLSRLTELGKASPWVRRGDSVGSLLIRELSWKGRMFGAFTDAEVTRVRHWIDSLGREPVELDEAAAYWRLVGENPQVEIATYPWDLSCDIEPSLYLSQIYTDVQQSFPRPPIAGNIVVPAIFMPLWFSHCCLLESTVAVPFRSISLLHTHMLRVLRAESGFLPETAGVAGIDEQRQFSHSSLVDLGLEMWERYARSCHDGEKRMVKMPTCLDDVLTTVLVEGDDDTLTEARGYAHAMLHWSKRPVANLSLLLGLSRAFLDFETWVAGSSELLSERGRLSLGQLVARKSTSLSLCVEELRSNDDQYKSFLNGYSLGRTWVEKAIM